MSGSVAFRIPAGATAPSGGSYSAELTLSPLFDAAGGQISADTDFISHLLTPTGLPIERSVRGGQGLGPLPVTPLERAGDLLTGSFDGSGAIPVGLPDGTYLLLVGFGFGPEFSALAVSTQQSAPSLTQPMDGAIAVALVTVGNPAPPPR